MYFDDGNLVIEGMDVVKETYYKEPITLPQGDGERISAPSGSVGTYIWVEGNLKIKADGTVILTTTGTGDEPYYMVSIDGKTFICPSEKYSKDSYYFEFDGKYLWVGTYNENGCVIYKCC